jgi:hypothetical protein
VTTLAVTLLCNDFGSEVIGEAILPFIQEAVACKGYRFLSRQEKPVVMNVKGAPASGKSTMRPLQKILAGKLRLWAASTTRPTRSWWCEVTAFSLIYREYPANYGIRTTSPLALNKAGLFERRPVHQFQMKGLAFCAIDSCEALSP